MLEPCAVKTCAAERAAESLAQPEEARRDASGPSDLPENESWRGKEHIGKSGSHWKTQKVSSREARAIWRKLNCLNPNLQWWKRTLIATASNSDAVGSVSSDFRGT